MAIQKSSSISAPVVNRVLDKQGNVLGYLVKSDGSDSYYQVSFNYKSARYECSCVSKKPCKHERAVQEVLRAKAEAAPLNGNRPAPVAHNQGNQENVNSSWLPMR